MRFLALLKKEMRECLPWFLLAAVVFLLMGGIVLRLQQYHHPWSYTAFENGQIISPYRMLHTSTLNMTGAWLFLTSIGLGLALGIRQFWMSSFRHLWGFELQRSVTRQKVLCAKLLCAAILFVLSLGVIWVAFCRYASLPGVWLLPPTIRVICEGWLFIALGFVVYLATALVGLNTAKWYATRGLPLGFAVIVIIATMLQWQLWISLAVLIAGGAILLLQVFETFLNKEF